MTAIRLGGSDLAGPGGAPLPTMIEGALPAPVTVATPLALESWMAAGILGGLVVIAWFVVEERAARAAIQAGGDSVASWTWPRGLGWLRRTGLRRGVLLVALIAAVGTPYNVGAVSRLGSGSYGQTSMKNLLGGRIAYGPSQKSALFYSLTTGSTAAVGFSIRNDGSIPLTVVGLGPGSDDSEELRRFAHEATTVEQFGTGDQSVDDSPTVSFTPFELQPGDERFLVLAIKAPVCGNLSRATPAPTLSPGPSIDMNNYEPGGGSFAGVDSVSMRFSALGVAQTAVIPLFQTIEIVCPD